MQIASEAKGKVGVAAMVLETGDTVSLNPRDHFPMQSVYKLPIGVAVMKQVDSGKVKLDQRVQATTDNYVGKDSHNPVRDKYPDGGELSVNKAKTLYILHSCDRRDDPAADHAGGQQSY